MSAVVEFGFQAAPVFSGVDRLESKLKGLNRTVSGLTGISLSSMLPAIGIAGAVTGIRSLMSNMDDLADTALRLNESTDVIQRVTHASEILASVDAEGVTKSFLKLEKALGEVGNEKASKALADLGLTAENLTRMPLDEKVIAVADAFNTARATGTGYNDILNLLGKSAGDLIPMFAQGGEALREMMEGAPVVIEATVQRLAAANDQLDTWFNHFKVGAAEGVAAAMGLGESLLVIAGGLLQGESLADIAELMTLNQQAAIDAQAAAQEKTKASKESAAAGIEAASAAAAEEDAAKKTAAQQVKIVEAQARLDEQKHKAGLDEMSTAKRLAAVTVDAQKAAEEEAALRAAAVPDAGKIIAAESKKVQLQTELNHLQKQLVSDKERAADATKREAEQAAEVAKHAAAANAQRKQSVMDAETEYRLLKAKAHHRTREVAAIEREARIQNRAKALENDNGLDKDAARKLATKMTDLEDRADGKRSKIRTDTTDRDPLDRRRSGPLSGYLGPLSRGGPLSKNGGLSGYDKLQRGEIGVLGGKGGLLEGKAAQNAAGADKNGLAKTEAYLAKLLEETVRGFWGR